MNNDILKSDRLIVIQVLSLISYMTLRRLHGRSEAQFPGVQPSFFIQEKFYATITLAIEVFIIFYFITTILY